MVIREAQLADIFEITNILIEEMYTEVGIYHSQLYLTHTYFVHKIRRNRRRKMAIQ